VTACVRPVSAKVGDVVAVYTTPFGYVEVPQGRRIVFAYGDETRTYLVEPELSTEIPHASHN
jgi:hypothetical protein